jgi:hypothetical protein
LNSTKYASIRIGKSDPDLEGGDKLFHQKGGSTSFGAKMVLSLNGVDPGCRNSIIGSTCRAKCSDILHDIADKYLSVCKTIK